LSLLRVATTSFIGLLPSSLREHPRLSGQQLLDAG